MVQLDGSFLRPGGDEHLPGQHRQHPRRLHRQRPEHPEPGGGRQNSCPNDLGSKVTFNATAGTTYRIAVAEPGGDNSEHTFTLELIGKTSPIDTTPPGVTGTSPANNATGSPSGS